MNGHQPPSDTPANLTQRLNIDFALQAAGLGVWEFDPVTKQVRWDDRCRQLYGVAKNNQITYEQAIQYIHPDDQARVDQAVQQALSVESNGQYDVTYRTVGADDGLLRWVRFMGKAESTPAGRVYRFAGVAQEVTQQVLARQQLEDSEARFRSLIEEAPIATCLFVGRELRIDLANQPMIDIWGKGRSVFGKPLSEALPELTGQPFLAILDEVFTTGIAYEAKAARAEIEVDGVMGNYYFDFTYKPQRNANGSVYAIIDMAIDVTDQVLARQQLEASEARYRLLSSELETLVQQRTQELTASEAFARNLFQNSPVANLVLVGQDMIIQTINEGMLHMLGRDQSIIGQPLMSALPELESTPLLDRLRQVLKSGEVYHQPEEQIDLIRFERPYTGYFHYIYTPLTDATSQRMGVVVTAIEVTTQVLARQHLEEVEARLRTIITNLPSATVVFRGRELVVESPSKYFIDLIDRGPDVVGKPLGELMPELESQSYLNILDQVYTTGQPYRAFGAPVSIRQADGSTVLDYFDLIYTPLFNAQGQVYAILSVATNVTEQIRAHQQVERSETALRNAVELAELGHFSVDVGTNLITVSPRVADWFGFDDVVADAQSFIDGVGQSDRQLVATRLANALQPGSDGRYDVEHSVIHAKTGHQIILHVLGQLYKNDAGQVLRLEGICQDITPQREQQAVLEQQVQERTQELAAANEELAASNEELSATNKEVQIGNQALETANTDLLRSNQNLEQFAYIASHDLQEPLRKIQQFGDLLKNQYGDHLGDGLAYLERMQTAASRMSVLIRDLLAFSRISTTQVIAQPVGLNQVVSRVLDALSVVVEESGAQVVVTSLPVVPGDRSQLDQLFQNLLSNAVKFRRTNPLGELVTPQISIKASLVAESQLPPSVHPSRYAQTYHCIEVADNGIGFKEKYVDRMFQVFQRLHGKNEFAGTGIGLAIVQKVVTNHGGGITATSEPGQGATFSVYLPA
ncbi:PAS domain-containing sensor histidine kinase [Spirosoma linguale]|uniref:histidine kinase n=1 Tax=Spirosoma linguale (strain ATCC 33905 / DSM 74 / LMG 10896 / Claus 1) TaxID=504472 RepID=D2QBZ4_SPILD|nr:PAS/PAC sensor signal transduction histidine kinase [Spirosoma linguale DSM 74]